MSTRDKKVNIFLKKFLTQQQITENFLDYLQKLILESFAETWQSQGIFEPDVSVTNLFSSDTVDTFDLITPLRGTNGPLGNILDLDSADANNIAFENALGITYSVGLRFVEIEAGVETNVRSGEKKYTFFEEGIGEKGEPNSVVDDGDETLTMIVDNVFEAGVSNAGRKVLVYLKNPISDADTFETRTVIWDGSNNKIETAAAFGQTLGNISTDAADYVVIATGPTVRRNTDLSLDPDIMFLGTILGVGAGSSPTVFDQSGAVNLAFGLAGLTTLFDVEHSLVDGVHTDINPDTVTTKPTVTGIQLDTQVAVGDEDTPDAPVVHTIFQSAGGTGLQGAKWVVRDSGGNVIAFVDAHGNAYFQNLAAVDSIFQSNLIVEGNTTLGDDINTDIITMNSVQQSLSDMLYIIDSNNDGTNSYKFYNHSQSAANLLMEILDVGDVVVKRDVLTGTGSTYSKNSNLSPVISNASLNEVYDETLFRKLLKVTPNNPGDKELLIAGTTFVLADGSQFKLSNGPVVSNFTGGSINFETGVNSDGDNFTPIDFTGQNDKWFKFSLNLLQNDQILVLSNDSSVGANFGTTKANTPEPPVSEEAISFAIIAIQNDSATSTTAINALLEENIDRLPIGGGGGGAGDAAQILVRMEALLDESFFQWLEPNIFSIDEQDKISSTTGSFSVVTKTVDFDISETLESISLLDPEFLAGLDDILKAQVVLVFDKNNIDPSPVVELTPNGDIADLQAVTMVQLETGNDSFVGELSFDLSLLTKQVVDEYDVANEDSDVELEGATNRERISQEFVTNTDTNVAEQFTFFLSKLGAPVGLFKLNIHEDNAGVPGNILSQILVNIADLSAGDNDVVKTIGRHVLSPSTKYHLSIETDAAYKASFSTGVDALRVRIDSSLSTIADRMEFDGTNWSAVIGSSMPFKLEGRKIDLKMKYTASASAKLKGYGVYYGEEAQSVQRLKRRNAFVFNGAIDNLNEFQLTFDADPEFLIVNDVFQDKQYIAPRFSLQNNKIVFPENFFLSFGDVYLVIKQVEAGSFDGNPENLKLLTENHLGSNDPALNKSIPGRGPIVSANVVTTLVELTVDENFNLVIKEA